ncbi:acyl-CoA dehydrogenase family protein [Isoptericola variabilis]|uniref:glutaryl-CoA dehydrogenase (ETF) n=1 Tax=Isoptericola variabilis (strain 225) TaxID=743718 RepID=F6FQF3_ISOV2|nr:acyl-CoA dehydrogenase family protein [Isoptericola variabilis]AEG43828.1 Glutaryl-CoA dehydrogenase [Isoptericola variabilis 225]TWH34128.1 glutaryl-CoA dehydrogenase [Isoptericola variabilis J7]
MTGDEATRTDPTDLLALDAQLSDDERATRDRVRALVDAHVRPHVARWFADAVFPRELVPVLGEAGLLGMHLEGYGCAGRSAVEYGLAMAEVEAADSGIRTFVSVQGSLAMSAIAKHGSEEQKQHWLPRMATGEAIGCFALTEPTAGSDPAGMRTRAVRDGDTWVIDGAKRWIGLASVADVAVVWAKVTEDDAGDGRERVRGFLVPTSTPGFRATPIEPKLSLRASVQCDVALDGVRVPADAILPHNPGLRGPFACLDEARYGIAWGAAGAARDCLEVALAYAQQREQFGRPLAAFQLTQAKLVEMALEVSRAQLLALHLGRLKDAGRLEPHQVSAGKLSNVRAALDVARTARTILGGNGVTLEHSPMRHAANLESVRTYEGTDEVHTLVLGRHLTGHAAFR